MWLKCVEVPFFVARRQNNCQETFYNVSKPTKWVTFVDSIYLGIMVLFEIRMTEPNNELVFSNPKPGPRPQPNCTLEQPVR